MNVLARRTPSNPVESEAKLTAFVETNTEKWPEQLKSIKPPPQIFFSSLGTTRANAGGFDKQYKLEHDLHLELAQAAKDAGYKVFVLISSHGADPKSMFGYTRMKGEIEEGIKALGFDHTIIIRPGIISGTRSESRPAEAIIRKVAAIAGRVNTGLLKDPWSQDADKIGKAAVNAGIKALNGKGSEDKVQFINGREILLIANEQ